MHLMDTDRIILFDGPASCTHFLFMYMNTWDYIYIYIYMLCYFILFQPSCLIYFTSQRTPYDTYRIDEMKPSQGLMFSLKIDSAKINKLR